jgi:hypothetical protein
MDATRELNVIQILRERLQTLIDTPDSSGNPPMFKDRPLVALTEGTIDGIPQNHAPQTQVHLPATFGLENFTMRPASTPVIVTLSHVGEQFGSRYSLTR